MFLYVLFFVCALATAPVFAESYGSFAPGTEPADVTSLNGMYRAGQFDQAMAIASRILVKDPDNVSVRYIRANLYLRLQRYEDALPEYRYCAVAGSGTQVEVYSKQAITSIEALLAAGAPANGPAPANNNGNVLTGRGGAGGYGTIGGAAGDPSAFGPAVANVPRRPAGTMHRGDIQSYISDMAPGRRRDRQTQEARDRLAAEAAAHISDRRRTLRVRITKINSRATDEINSIPQYFTDADGNSYPNPDFASASAEIRRQAEERIAMVRTDAANEDEKMLSYYRNLADSYDRTQGNIRTRQGVQRY
ncbi:MAG: tetratricopeptide repeat protein [Cyanobacteria bacterium REEB67]|nr:tetratricopeptide repeat protein [Cyanobacteria bacterium REEB67]